MVLLLAAKRFGKKVIAVSPLSGTWATRRPGRGALTPREGIGYSAARPHLDPCSRAARVAADRRLSALPGGMPVWVLGRTLQLLGMGNVLVGFYVGLTEEQGMGPELILLAIGSVLFLVGRLLEGRAR